MTSDSKAVLNIVAGIPSHDFFVKAWAGEPLTNVLTNTDMSFAFPGLDEEISLIATQGKEVIGQCSMNRTSMFWNHVEKLDVKDQNSSTQAFVRINLKAIEVERKHLAALKESEETSFHNAGIAVLPTHRGKNISLAMLQKQIEVCKKHRVTTLFCETTNRFSAIPVEKSGFSKIAEFPYPKLAEELKHDGLKKLDDSLTVWCLKI